MENFKLRTDEVVLYKGDVTLKDKKGNTQLFLTNYNLFLVNRYKKLFSKEKITVLEYPLNTVKMYNGEPQIKAFNELVADIYLLESQFQVVFLNKEELDKFINEAHKLLKETFIEKGVRKIKGAIDFVEDKIGVSPKIVVGCIAGKGKVKAVVGAVGKIGKALVKKKDSK